jgi:hypothetical protein
VIDVAGDSTYCNYYYNFDQVTVDGEHCHSFELALLLHTDLVTLNAANVAAVVDSNCYLVALVSVQEVLVAHSSYYYEVSKADCKLMDYSMRLMADEEVEGFDLDEMLMGRPKDAYYNVNCKLLGYDESVKVADNVMRILMTLFEVVA